AYLFWGNTVPRYAKLKDNMVELDGPIVDLDLPHFTEAPWIHKYDGTYYLSYAYGYPEQIAYATADAITGPYTFQGVINDTIPNSPTNHQSIIEFGGDWYFFYHNAALPGGGEYRRSVAVERLFYDDEGRIHPITQAVDGLGVERPEGNAEFLADGTAPDQPGDLEYVTNPVAPRVADPWVYRHTDGYYYLIGSVPAYDRIDIRRAETLQGLAFAEPVTVWRKHESGPMSRHIWAPELHYVDGTWVIHYAAGREEEPFHIRMYALTTEAENPLEGEWTERGQVTTNWDSFSLDATTFEHRGTRYLVWAQHDPDIGGNTNLYIAEMDSPWSITGEQVLITQPEYDWEVQGYRVNEGAAVLKKNGRIWMTYSASATDANYAMGLLWADEDADLMDPDSWTKSPVPVMTTNAENGVFGPGHN
ncbi:MAG: family 43 glycosylhydrolase, partial [Halobacteriales archaeon]|nr:family 43 glycosylhydrolase [Halobacteriales archaeon]